MANCAQCGRKLPPFSLRRICEWCVRHEAAKRGEDEDSTRQPVMAVPWVHRESSITLTKFLFGANVAVFIAMVAASGSIDAFPDQILSHFGANYAPYTLTGDWWRLFTYMFVHADVWHIAFNLWCLWDLGQLCESLYGTGTFGAVYLMTGISGGLASIVWHPGIGTVGASGAVFGLAGALIASLYLGEFTLPSFAIQSHLRGLYFFVGFNILFGISPLGDLFGVHVDNACHIGGFLGGLVLGALIARFAPQLDHPARRVMVLAVVAIALAGVAMGIWKWRGAPYRVARALDSMSEKNPARALSDLQALVREQPNSAQLHFALAQLNFKLRHFSQAEAEFKRVLDLLPQDHAARVDLGLTYMNENRPADAEAVFEQSVTEDAEDPDAHYGLGVALSQQGKFQPAIDELKKASALGVQGTDVDFEIGQSYAGLKMYDDAIAAYLKEKANGDNADIEAALAAAYDAKGMTQQATEARNRAAELRNDRRN